MTSAFPANTVFFFRKHNQVPCILSFFFFLFVKKEKNCFNRFSFGAKKVLKYYSNNLAYAIEQISCGILIKACFNLICVSIGIIVWSYNYSLNNMQIEHEALFLCCGFLRTICNMTVFECFIGMFWKLKCCIFRIFEKLKR